MAKKDLKQDVHVVKSESPEKATPNATVKNMKGRYIMTTILCDPQTMQKIRGIAYWDRVKIKNVVHAALNAYVKEYESIHGPLKIPN